MLLLGPGMKTPFVPIPGEAFYGRLSAAGFRAVPPIHGGPDEEVYELSHHRDPRYVVRVHSSLRRSEATVRERGEGAVSVVALALQPDPDVVFNAPSVSRAGTLEEVLDRVIDCVREAYGAINRRRLTAQLSAQAHEVSVRSRRLDLRRRW